MAGKKTTRLTVDSATSDPIYIPRETHEVGLCVSPNSGTCLVQYTISSFDDIQSDNAIWADWDDGAVSDVAIRTLYGPVNAVRFLAAGGDSHCEVTFAGA